MLLRPGGLRRWRGLDADSVRDAIVNAPDLGAPLRWRGGRLYDLSLAGNATLRLRGVDPDGRLPDEVLDLEPAPARLRGFWLCQGAPFVVGRVGAEGDGARDQAAVVWCGRSGRILGTFEPGDPWERVLAAERTIVCRGAGVARVVRVVDGSPFRVSVVPLYGYRMNACLTRDGRELFVALHSGLVHGFDLGDP